MVKTRERLREQEFPSFEVRHVGRLAPIKLPVAGSHSRTVLSPPALPSNCTSGLNATDLTRTVWPVRARSCWPVPGS